MKENRKTPLERDIITSLRRYRLQEEIRIIEEEGTPTPEPKVEAKEKRGFRATVKKFLGEDVREMKNKVTGENDLAKARQNLAVFESKVDDASSTDLTTDMDSFKRTIDVFFDRDGGGARVGMALELGLDEFNKDGTKFLRREASRKSLSAFLLGDPEKLGQILGFFTYSFKKIGAPKINSFSKGFLVGLSAGSIALLGVPLLIKPFRNMLKGVSAGSFTQTGASELLLYSTLVGGGYIKRKDYNKKATAKVREMAKHAIDGELACSFATALTLWRFAQSENKEESKETLDLFIKMVDDIRSDAEYMGLVEKDQTEANLRKIVVCDNAINFIGKLLLGENPHLDEDISTD